MPNNKSLPTDRRAEAESDKKHGPKCWGRTSYSDEMAHCYCADTPPSAGPDAGLETQGFIRRSRNGGSGWTFMDAPEDVLFYTSEDRPERYEVRELVNRQSAAAALEAAAEREGELRAKLAEAKKWLEWAHPLAVIAVEDHRVTRVKAGHQMTGTYKSGTTYVGIYQSEVDEIEGCAEFLKSLSAIPTPGRE